MKRIIRKVIQYFDLGINTEADFDINSARYLTRSKTAKASKRRSTKGIIWGIAMFGATICGVLGKYIFDVTSKDSSIHQSNFSIQKLIVAIIISVVIFPVIYKQASLDPKNPGFIQLCVAFQSGFFWQTIIGGINVGQ